MSALPSPQRFAPYPPRSIQECQSFSEQSPTLEAAAAVVRRKRQARSTDEHARVFVPPRPPSPEALEVPPECEVPVRSVADDRRKPGMEYAAFARWRQERHRKRAQATVEDTASSPFSRAARAQAPGDPQYRLVPPQQQWMPGLNTLFMEKVFSRDMWHYVSTSGMRVNFCRCGGSYKDDEFRDMRHEPTFAKLADPSTARSSVKAPVDRKQPRIALSARDKSPGARGAGADRGTLLFRLTDARSEVVASEESDVLPSASTTQRGRHEVDVEPVVVKVRLLDIRGDGPDAGRNSQRRPKISPEQKAAAKAIGAANSEFRRMVEYRRQDIHSRAEGARQQHRSSRLPDGQDQHPRFQRQLQDLGKTLYLAGAEEVERWSEDRERNFKTKYDTIDISNTEPTWQRAMGRIRGTVAAKLETDFSQERLQLQEKFSEKFCGGVRKLFGVRLSSEGTRLLLSIAQQLGTGAPFGPAQVKALVETIPADAYFLDDVTSIVYSLAVSLDVPPAFWLHDVREKTKFLSNNKELVEPDENPDSARWVLRLREADLGPNVLVYALSAPVCHSLTPSERAALVARVAATKRVAAVLATTRPELLCDEVKTDAAELNKSKVRCSVSAKGPVATTKSHRDAIILNSADHAAWGRALARMSSP